MDLGDLKDKIRSICEDSGIAMLGVFGSVARGEDRPDSDVDILIRFAKPIGLVDLIRLEDRFERALGRRVDLGVEGSLHPLIKEQALKDLKILYEV
ncbi:MAG: nucleotidyltransferase family protein [Acidobacteria bacterium]|nr:nucleotidyltransferase family protein [Acidobacteriota bacterium]